MPCSIRGARNGARALPFLLCVALAASCSNVRVSTDFDPNFAFSSLRTYAWMPAPHEPGSRTHNALADSRVRAAVDANLAAKGFGLAPLDQADFLVTHHIGIETGIDVQTIHTTHRYGRSAWHGVGTSRTVVNEYERGTLLIDVLLPGGRSLVWRGSGSARLRNASNPEERERRIRDAVDQILASFPPG